MRNHDKQVIIYLRVSTNAQETENQMQGITAYAEKAGLTIKQAVSDTASGKIDWRKRKIGEILKNSQKGDVIITSEISRLARSTLQVLEIMREAAEREVVIIVTKNNLIMDGSMQSKITSTILGLAAEIERDFIQARTQEAITRRRESGLPMGRPQGKVTELPLDKIALQLDKWEALGLSKEAIAKLAGVSRGTLYLWMQRRRPQWIKSENTKELTK